MVHLTETCDAGAPHLVLHADTTPANVHEAMRVEAIHAALAAKGLVPSEHLVDSAYISADHLVRAREQHGIDLVGPGRSPTGWQARTKGAFDTSDFAIDWRSGPLSQRPDQHELARLPRQGNRPLRPRPVQRSQLQPLPLQGALHRDRTAARPSDQRWPDTRQVHFRPKTVGQPVI